MKGHVLLLWCNNCGQQTRPLSLKIVAEGDMHRLLFPSGGDYGFGQDYGSYSGGGPMKSGYSGSRSTPYSGSGGGGKSYNKPP